MTTENITIEKLVYGGEGLGRLPSGEVIFVPWVAPGDVATIQRLPGSKKPARGQLVSLQTASPLRVQPSCPDFGQCGGCHWQHIAPVHQRDWKRRIVQESLHRLGKLPDVPVLETLGHDATSWRYRNRAQWELDAQGRLGYLKAASHEIVPFAQCDIIPVALNQLASWLRQQFQTSPPRGIQRIEAFINRQDQILLGIEGSASAYHKQLAQMLGEEWPQVVGLVDLNAQEMISGDDFVLETLGENTFRISAGSFFQTNLHGAEALLATIDQWLLPDASTSLLDLYAGVGLFSIHLKSRFQRVLAIENNDSALADAEYNLARNKALNVACLPGDARTVLAKTAEDFEVAVIDPPRSGCQPDVLHWLSQHIQKQILYVSCNPTTLARDLRVLSDNGWQVKQVQPIDMFPQTYHVEAVVNLVKTG